MLNEEKELSNYGEPWSYDYDIDIDEDSREIEIFHSGASIAKMNIGPDSPLDFNKSNLYAARIILCVNALTGLNTWGVQELVDAAKKVVEWNLKTGKESRELDRYSIARESVDLLEQALAKVTNTEQGQTEKKVT